MNKSSNCKNMGKAQTGAVTPSLRKRLQLILHQTGTEKAGGTCTGNGAEQGSSLVLVEFPTDWPFEPSEQLVMLYRRDSAYRALCEQMRCLLEGGVEGRKATANGFKRFPHLAPLGNWFAARHARVQEKEQWGEPSPELMEWPVLAWHLGPNPAPGVLSIDRIDPTQNYRLHNVRWADRATQAVNQSRNRKNLWMNTAITDKQLVAELAGLKIVTSADAIKMVRYRIRHAKGKDGVPLFQTPEAIHGELLRRLKVPAYVPPSKDPVAAEPLMPGLGVDWKAEKRAKPWMTNIDFQREWVADQEGDIIKEIEYHQKLKKPYEVAELEPILIAVRDFRRKLNNRYEILRAKNVELIKKKIDPYATETPPTPAGFGNYPAAVQSIAGEQTKKPKFEAPPKPTQKKVIATAEDVEKAMKELGLS